MSTHSDVIIDADSRPGAVPPPETRGRDGIAVCLSGGGFRASLFHLGALRRFHEVGLLGKIKTFSSVSGGSILTGYLAGRIIDHGLDLSNTLDYESNVAVGFREIAGRDLRTWPMLRNLPWNWLFPGVRVRQMQNRYRDRITSRTLGELPTSPNFIFCSTDMVFGVSWTFTREESGDYLAGYAEDAKDWPIAQAIAASACFPPLLGPMPLRLKDGQLKRGHYRGPNGDKLCRGIGLSDGGVYDNMGLEPVWKNHECVLVSDCGGLFNHQIDKNYVSRLYRYTGVVMNQAAAVRKRLYFQGIDETRRCSHCRTPLPPLYRGGYWGLGGNVADYLNKSTISIEGYSAALVDEAISRVRTDLDRFTMPEMKILENHGYLLAAAVLARRRPELIPANAPPVKAPHSEFMAKEDLVRTALKYSGRRVSISRLFRSD